MARCALWWLMMLVGTGPAWADESSPRFERDIAPIVRARCWKCHGAVERKGGLSLRSVATMLAGGDSGPAAVKGKAEESLIIEQVENGVMPPGNAEKLSPA